MAVAQNLSGKILLAHPMLRDPNFRRTIVFLVSHEPETGAIGFVVNRPAHRSFSELELEKFPMQGANSAIYLGGPVSPENVVFATLHWDPIEEWLTFRHFNEPMDYAMHEAKHTLTILGYAGWSEGQLEEEIAGNTWIVLDPVHDLIDADAATWKKLVTQAHPNLKLLAEIPDDPSLN